MTREHIHTAVVVAVFCLASSTWAWAEKSTRLNVVANPGFEHPQASEGEAPETWHCFAKSDKNVCITRKQSFTGEQAVKIRTSGEPNITQGLIQGIEVTSGEKYSFRAHIVNNREDRLGGTAYGQMVVEWHDARGNEVGRDWTSRWDRDLSRLRWERITLAKVPAPEGAVEAIVGIHLYDGDKGGQGSFLVDEIVVTSP